MFLETFSVYRQPGRAESACTPNPKWLNHAQNLFAHIPGTTGLAHMYVCRAAVPSRAGNLDSGQVLEVLSSEPSSSS